MKNNWHLLLLFGLSCCIFSMGCDSVEPSEDNIMVVEGFFDAGGPLPFITITKAQSLDQPSTIAPTYIQDASLRIFLDNREIIYAPSDQVQGAYAPISNTISNVPPNSQFRAEIEWQSQRASTQDIIPTPISIDSVSVLVPSKPVAAVLVDTLRLDNPNVGARKGYIYLIEVTISWTANTNQDATEAPYWIETRLIPHIDFSSTVLDVFLLTEEVKLENDHVSTGTLQRSWSGVYAVPTPDSLSPPPSHNLTVQLIRSSKAYADFASSRNNPERREPVSNIDGAIGVLAGIARDALEFEVIDGLATAQR